jgi:hypothetical protein
MIAPSRRTRLRAALLVSALAIGFALSSVPAHAATPGTPADIANAQVGDLDQLSQAELELLHSSTPKTINVDAYSGDVVSVTKAAPVISTLAAYQNGCTSGRGCWQGSPPTLNIGFTLGVTDGNWVQRRNFTVPANRYVKLCWKTTSFQPFCMPERNGDNATISLGSDVTGTRVDMATSRTA